MTSQGKVVSIEGDKLKVSVDVGTECLGCPSKSHCNMGDGKGKTISVINLCGAEVNDHIIFETEPSKVLISSFLIWILPIISMFVGYFVVINFAQGFWPVLAAMVFLFLSFFLLRIIDKAISGGKSFYPVANKKINCPDEINK